MNDKKWKKCFSSIQKREGNTFIQSLLDAGLDVNALNSIYGRTMLGCASECGNLEIIEFLVQKGADGNVANTNGSKPLHMAAMNGHKDAAKFFIEMGICVDSCDDDKCTPLHYAAEKIYIPFSARESYQELVHFLVDSDADLNAVNRNGDTPLLLAARNSRKDIVELLIKLGADVECCDGDQWTVLHRSCKEGWSGIVRSLVEGVFDIDLNARNSRGCTPLIIAAEYSCKEVVELLMESGADFECQDAWDRTVLHFVCAKGWLDIVKCLVNKGCNLNVKDFKGHTPLLRAASSSHPSVLEYLIESGADVNCGDKDEHTVLHLACTKGWLDVVKCLVNKGCNLNTKSSDGQTPLMKAAYFSHPSVLEYLIESGADVINCCVEDEQTLLHFSCIKGWLDVVKCLVNKGCNLNAKDSYGQTPLMKAAYFSHPSVLEYLIESRADVINCYDEDEQTLLHFSCIKGWLDVVKCLVNKGCNLNAKDSYGQTPLVKAAYFSHPSVLEYLIESGADVNCSDESEHGMLHQACIAGWLNVVKCLVNKGCNLNAKDSDGGTHLLRAASHSHYPVVDYLIESGADVNCCDENGRTVLHYACDNGWLDVVKSLMKTGCDLNARNYSDTPLHFAARACNLEIIKQLLKAGANCFAENDLGETAFNDFINCVPSIEGIILFLENGAYFQPADYNSICENPSLKDGILRDVELCTRAVINKYNNVDLPKIYEIPAIRDFLPPIEKLNIVNGTNVAQDIAQCVKNEIQTEIYCNVLNVRPIVLNSLCVRSLVEYYGS